MAQKPSQVQLFPQTLLHTRGGLFHSNSELLLVGMDSRLYVVLLEMAEVSSHLGKGRAAPLSNRGPSQVHQEAGQAQSGRRQIENEGEVGQGSFANVHRTRGGVQFESYVLRKQGPERYPHGIQCFLLRLEFSLVGSALRVACGSTYPS